MVMILKCGSGTIGEPLKFSWVPEDCNKNKQGEGLVKARLAKTSAIEDKGSQIAPGGGPLKEAEEWGC